MKKALVLLFLCFTFVIFLVLNDNYLNNNLNNYQKAPEKASNVEEDYRTTFVPLYSSKSLNEPELRSLQCPIPLENRVKNYTGIQCVYSSIEMLGRWAEEPKLINPPITSRSDCKGYSSPRTASERLNKIGVNFEQSWGDKKKGIELIKKAMKEGRGCLWDVPGHAMVLVHYSESENRVCWVDNADYKLRIQETTVIKFKERWNSWVLVIYADNNAIRYKLNPNFVFPIIENGQIKEYPRDFIPYPSFILF